MTEYSTNCCSYYSTSLCRYDLCCIIIHHGRCLTQGHYTSVCRLGEIWYHFNDDRVTSVSEEWVQAQMAYVLLYERSSMRQQRDPREW